MGVDVFIVQKILFTIRLVTLANFIPPDVSPAATNKIFHNIIYVFLWISTLMETFWIM